MSCDVKLLINRSCESEWVYLVSRLVNASRVAFQVPRSPRLPVCDAMCRCTDFEILSFYEIASCWSHRLTSSSNSMGQELAGIYKSSRGLASFRLAAEHSTSERDFVLRINIDFASGGSGNPISRNMSVSNSRSRWNRMEELGESLERLRRNLRLILAFDHTRDKIRGENVTSVKGKYPFVEIQIPISRNKTMTNANSFVVGWICKRFLR